MQGGEHTPWAPDWLNTGQGRLQHWPLGACRQLRGNSELLLSAGCEPRNEEGVRRQAQCVYVGGRGGIVQLQSESRDA